MDERQEKKYARDEREDGGDKPDGHAETGQSNEDQVDRQEDSFGLRHTLTLTYVGSGVKFLFTIRGGNVNMKARVSAGGSARGS